MRSRGLDVRDPSELWIPRRRLPNVTALICFPSSGSTAAAFSAWKQVALPDFEIVPLKLPGRGVRLKEASIESMPVLVEALGQAIGPVLPKSYYVFGQCLGGILAYEFVRWLDGRGFTTPKHLFVAGCWAPMSDQGQTLSAFDEVELIEQLRAWGGTPDELLSRRDVLDLMLPPVRADLRLLESYEFKPEPPLSIPITAIRGASDGFVGKECLNGWRDCTTGPVTTLEVEGAHFLDPAVVIATIRAQVDSHAEAPR